VSAVAAVRTRAVAVPAWAWLAGIVVCSAVIRIALGHRVVAPWIMIDEIVYSELAKSFAANGHFLVRGVPSHGYGFVYPVLIAPAWRIFTSVPDAYAAAKVINAVVMSLAAVPAYFLARRVLATNLSLVVSVLTVAIPSMLYTGTLMTENAFYPVFLTCVLALVAMLERPTPRRQLVVLVLIGFAYATRQQAIALVPAALTAPLLLSPRRLRPFATLYGIVAGGAVVALLATAARGRSPLTLLGAYRAATTSSYSVSGILHFFVYQLGEIDLYLGVIPFAALIAMWLGKRTAFVAASLAVVFWLTVEVAAFASQPSVNWIEERNLFYIAPLALVALVGLAADGVVPRNRRALVIAVTVAGVLPVFIPFSRFIDTKSVADTFALLPWWWVQDHWITLGEVRWAALGVSLAAGAVFVLLPRRYALVLPGLVAVYFVLTTAVVANGRHGIHQAALGKLWAGIRTAHPDWIDRAVGPDAKVAILRDQRTPDEVVWENEFFNRSVDKIYAYNSTRVPDPLPEETLTLARSGSLGVDVQYVLGADVVGKLIATDGDLGVSLYRVDGPLFVHVTHVRGLYPDTWSGKQVTYTRSRCTGGLLTVQLESDASLFKAMQVVTAYEGGRRVGTASITPAGTAALIVPLRGAAGSCTVTFDVAHTAVPGHGDPRVLGAHFLSFTTSP
jgi:hypothetical protein